MIRDETILKLQEELRNIKGDIFGQIKVKKRGEALIKLSSGEMLFYKSEKKNTRRSWVYSKTAYSIIKYVGTSGRVAYLVM